MIGGGSSGLPSGGQTNTFLPAFMVSNLSYFPNLSENIPNILLNQVSLANKKNTPTNPKKNPIAIFSNVNVLSFTFIKK